MSSQDTRKLAVKERQDIKTLQTQMQNIQTRERVNIQSYQNQMSVHNTEAQHAQDRGDESVAASERQAAQNMQNNIDQLQRRLDSEIGDLQRRIDQLNSQAQAMDAKAQQEEREEESARIKYLKDHEESTAKRMMKEAIKRVA